MKTEDLIKLRMTLELMGMSTNEIVVMIAKKRLEQTKFKVRSN